MDDKSKRYRTEILKILRDSGKPLGSTKITELLSVSGIETNERTVRFHLQKLDDDGMTRKISKRVGREITPAGLSELEGVNILGRLGFIVSKIDGLSYNMGFDPVKREGLIVLNVSLIPVEQFETALEEILMAFRAGLGMGRLALLRGPGEKIGNMIVPSNMVGFGTVCSVTLNGLLLKEGIPVASRYGSLLRMEGGRPVCFTELVDYLGTTLDPLEMFLRAGMTSVGKAARGQSGVVGASFREIPIVAGGRLEAVRRKLDILGLSGILAVGKPNQPLLNVSVDEGMIGMAIVGGLNPVAAAHEAGVDTINAALHCLAPYEALEGFENLRTRFRNLVK